MGQVDPFSYCLPEQRIAQRPVYPYESARLLIYRRDSRSIVEATFSDITKFLRNDDLLVFNKTRVRKSRLIGNIIGSQGRAELLLINKCGDDTWVALARPMRRLKPGKEILFGSLQATVLERLSEQELLISLRCLDPKMDLMGAIEEQALIPIPNYIRGGISDQQDLIDYQTSFAEEEGSIAAPTAALHFSPSLLENIKDFGCQIEFVTLHVGVASFRALWSPDEQYSQVSMPAAEEFNVDIALIAKLTQAKKMGRRIIAVGTTTVRALESSVSATESGWQATELFIRPGYNFKLIDGLVTNFHQPGTTHMFLVEAILGRAGISSCYNYALKNDFRFLSYGDGMMAL